MPHLHNEDRAPLSRHRPPRFSFRLEIKLMTLSKKDCRISVPSGSKLAHPDAMKHNAMKADLVWLLSSMVISPDLASLMAAYATKAGASPQWLFGARDKGRCFRVEVFNHRTFLSEGPMPLRFLVALIVFCALHYSRGAANSESSSYRTCAGSGDPNTPHPFRQGLRDLG